MIAWLDRLAAKPRLHSAVLIVYICFFLSMHVVVGGWLNGLFGGLTRQAYNALVLGVAVLGTCGLGYHQIRKRWKSVSSPREYMGIVLFTLVAVVLSFLLLMVIYVESIHFLQYALLAILVFPWLRSYASVVLFCMLVGAIDEAVQYLYLDTRAAYFDFNDIFLDTIGAGIGLLYMRLFGYQCQTNSNKWFLRPEWMLAIALGAGVLLLAVTGHFSINYNEASPAFFTLFKEPPEGFWTYPPGPYARYHILTPIPGMLLIVLSCWVYGRLDRQTVG